MRIGQSLSSLWANRQRITRWWTVGLGFTFLNIPILYVLVDVLAIPLAAATVLAGEAGLLVRFLVNDRWVFQEQRPTWHRLWQYHVAAAGGFVIWWSATNLLSRSGIHYLVASLLATAFSVAWSMGTNFLWVWRHQRTSHTAVAESDTPVQSSHYPAS